MTRGFISIQQAYHDSEHQSPIASCFVKDLHCHLAQHISIFQLLLTSSIHPTTDLPGNKKEIQNNGNAKGIALKSLRINIRIICA
jgi:hypothetical protein